MSKEELKSCPFCGGESVVQVSANGYQIVGCNTSKYKTMLCPQPSMLVYPDTNGRYDYKWWNTRAYEQEIKELKSENKILEVGKEFDKLAIMEFELGVLNLNTKVEKLESKLAAQEQLEEVTQ